MYDYTTSHFANDLDANTRAGDSDRDGTAERLRHHHAEGRIDVEEFQERLDRCYQATTVGQLQELVADLPQDTGGTTRHFHHRRLMWLAPILLAIFAIGAVGSGHGPHALLFVLGVFLVVRLFVLPRRRWGMRDPRMGARHL